jgi:hypothetical protein
MGFEGPKPSIGHEGGIQLRQSWARINELGIAVRTEVAQFVRFTWFRQECRLFCIRLHNDLMAQS